MRPDDRDAAAKTWREAARAFFHPRVLAMLSFGFAAGTPYLLIFGTLSVWLREAEVERSTLTFFSWAALGYSFKYVWAPLVDRLPVPGLTARLGRRRAWMLLSQLAIIAAILGMAASDPRTSLVWTGLTAVFLGFSAATQDIAIDAYRIEAVHKDLQAMMSSAYIAGYRIGMIVAGAGALTLASAFGGGGAYSYAAWAGTYACMALVMLVGVGTTLAVAEPEPRARPDGTAVWKTTDYLRFLVLFALAAATFVSGFVLSAAPAEGLKPQLTRDFGLPQHLAGFLVEASRLAFSVALAALAGWLVVRLRGAPAALLRQSYVEPFADFVRRYGKVALFVLLLIGTYRISDIVMGAIANVFYLDMGYTLEQIAAISKTFGLAMTIAGGFLGGVLSVRYGLLRILFLGALLSSATNLLFVYLAHTGNEPWLLVMVIVADNVSGGLAQAAFIAYLSSLTSFSFTATQYALFSSIMTLIPKVLAGYSGMMVDSVGYAWFFTGTALIGLPVLLLVVLVGRTVPAGESRASSEAEGQTR
jgi:PAT family beta-lactamase induction signal transducer AmpG